jgi:prepilin-type N-terminal cleavage/methylation domain-containing protein
MTGKRCFKTLQRGVTLLELSVVLLILVALAGLVAPYVGGIGSTASCQTTDATMHAVKEAIMGGTMGAGFYGDTLGQLPRDRYFATGYNLNYLFTRDDGLDNDGDGNWPSSDGKTNVDPDDEWRAYNAKTSMGWRGPYLQSGGAAVPASLGNGFSDTVTTRKVHIAIDANAGSQVLDAWGRPLVLQVPNPASCDKLTNKTGTKAGECARLVSAGSGSGLDSNEADIDTLIDDDTSTTGVIEDKRSMDDRILYLRIPTPTMDAANTPCDEN